MAPKQLVVIEEVKNRLTSPSDKVVVNRGICQTLPALRINKLSGQNVAFLTMRRASFLATRSQVDEKVDT